MSAVTSLPKGGEEAKRKIALKQELKGEKKREYFNKYDDNGKGGRSERGALTKKEGGLKKSEDGN